MIISNALYTYHFGSTRGQCENIVDKKNCLKNIPDISKMLLMIIIEWLMIIESLKFSKTNKLDV